MKEKYTIRRAESAADAPRLRALFDEVFHPEEVGVLAETMFHHLPGLTRQNWFIAEEQASGHLVAAFVLIPWQWELRGMRLKVAEMGIVGTQVDYRGQGLQRLLNRAFDQTLLDEGYDLAVIQGIPGFYDQFGYTYAIPLENHINLPLHLLPERTAVESYTFRLAQDEDISYLLAEDEAYRDFFPLATYRSHDHWHYLLHESGQTEYGSQFWLIEHPERAERFYARFPEEGFGEGLIVSEISVGINPGALRALFAFVRQQALERGKPYVRLNVHNETFAGQTAIALGAKPGDPYAWQIKVADNGRFLTTLAPILEQRLRHSPFHSLSGSLCLNFFNEALDLHWRQGRLQAIEPAQGESTYTFSLNRALFPALALGHRRWSALRHIRPDIFPNSALCGQLIDILFPAERSWIYEQY